MKAAPTVLQSTVPTDLGQFLLTHDSSRQRHTWIKPEAAITFKMLLMMSDNIARNM